jgi:SnoaL-like domain
MTTTELAKDFTELLKQGNDEGAAEKYNADDIVSHEAMEGPMAVCQGKDAVRQKGEWWRQNHELHGASVEGPFVNGNQFAVRLKYDVTPKATGEPVTMDEVGLYTVKDGKIIEERFFY